MSYIITTATTAEQWQRGRVTTRQAVPTLDAAREATVAIVLDRYPVRWPRKFTVRAARTLPESGGTIGPLPDGTVIEVRPS
jgi:hypothetical protein